MLALHAITKRYKKRKVLNGVTLTIPKGSCYGIVGPNGAGKSTLLKIIAHIIQDFDGDLQISDNKHNHMKKVTGYVPQEICLEPTLSAYSNLCFFGEIYGLHGKELKNRAKEVLQEIGLANRGHDKVKQYSGGMKRRLNIGCALMHRPKLVIMDEPTVGIDPQSRRYIFQMIQRLQNEGCTILYATHYMEEVEQLCNHVAFIDQGQIIEEDTVEDLLQQYAIPSVFAKASSPLPESVEAVGELVYRNNGILIKTDQPLLAMEKIVTFFQSHPTELERLELVQSRLEDVFFSLTGSALRDNKTEEIQYQSEQEAFQ